MPRLETIQVRTTTRRDLVAFFEHQQDRKAVHMAAFTAKDPTDRDAFVSHWSTILVTDAITKRTISVEGCVAGHIVSFERDNMPEITYWLGREYWGRGIATRAVSEFLERHFTTRPVYARSAKDNHSSIRVLEKCGFRIIGEERGFANARGAEIDEVVLKLGQ